jgi:hypothetical protein
MPPPLPTDTRLYRSVLDDFGVSYVPLGAGYRFIDLVGRAYRRAGAQLLGLPGAALSPPYLALCEEDRRNLEGLAAALKNGGWRRGDRTGSSRGHKTITGLPGGHEKAAGIGSG